MACFIPLEVVVVATVAVDELSGLTVSVV